MSNGKSGYSDWLVSFGINVVLSVLREVIKNPQRKEELERAMRKVWTQIGLVYGFES